MKLNRYVDDHIYLSAQAHSAFCGRSGGLFDRPDRRRRIDCGRSDALRFGGEFLLGAAGGGGVASGGGAIAQVLAWAGLPVTRDSELRVGLGAREVLARR